MNNFLFLGGDLRFVYAAARLNKFYDCFVYGFDKLHGEVHEETGVQLLREAGRYGNVVLPLPVSVDGEYITAPYCSGKIPLSFVAETALPGGTVYCGRTCDTLKKLCADNGLILVDYFEREELTVMNAAITAEGALGLIMKEQAQTVMGMRVLVTGYGRIAKILSKYLCALGAKVTVSARKFSDLTWARIMYCNAILLSEIDTCLGDFDTVVNTIPAQIFDREKLVKLKKDCLVIDLASKTGIADTELAKSAGVRVIWALSVPGKVAPITAGYIIADTILNIIAESGKGGVNYV